jgi:hypothetical protein
MKGKRRKVTKKQKNKKKEPTESPLEPSPDPRREQISIPYCQKRASQFVQPIIAVKSIQAESMTNTHPLSWRCGSR